jgi:hypothetical protein
MSYDSNVNITLFNNTGDNQTLVVFQQDPDINQIFETVFPCAWRVFKVGPTGGSAHVILPIQYQVGAGDVNDAFTGHVSYVQDTELKKKWEYTLKPDGYNELKEIGNQVDNSISCWNTSGTYCTMSLVKNNKPLLTYPEIGQNGVATFLPLTYIYLAWYNHLVEGAEIKAFVSAPQAVGVNLDGAQTVEGTLSKNMATGELTWAVKVNGTSVQLETDRLGRKRPETVFRAATGK